MSDDPFDDLLGLEDDFYKEGFEAGVNDSGHAGLIEGKLFGIEKGYEKALEIGKARGRALVWQQRLQDGGNSSAAKLSSSSTPRLTPTSDKDLTTSIAELLPLPSNARLKKHIEILSSLTDPMTIPKDNSDESVSEVDERITKIRARIKMISNLVGEAVSPAAASETTIEDSTGLSARH